MVVRSPRRISLKDGLDRSDKAFKRILVAMDGSESSLRAVKVAVRLARRNRAELLILSVVPRPSYAFTPIPTAGATSVPTLGLPDYYKYASKDAERWVSKAASLAKSHRLKVRKRVLKGPSSVVESITDYAASQKVDLIVVGRTGASGFKRLLLGGVSSGVVNHAASSVLVVR
jgi:nucleotide-binding universal stress UspA family protein